MLLLGVGFIAAAGVIGRSNPPDEALRVPGVEEIIPVRGAAVLQQQRVAKISDFVTVSNLKHGSYGLNRNSITQKSKVFV